MELGLEERGRRRERGLDDDSVCRLYSQSGRSSEDGARSSSVQTQTAAALREKLGERNPGAETRGREEAEV